MGRVGPVLVVQNMSDSSLGWLGEAFRAAGVEMTRVRANEGAALPGVDEVVAIVVLGGMQGAYEADRYPYLDAEMRLIREAASADVPTLGICLGAQLIAAALGGRAFPSEAVEVGWPDVILTDAGSHDPLTREVTGAVLVWHHDTFELPPDAELLASSRYPLAFRAGRSVAFSSIRRRHLRCSPSGSAARHRTLSTPTASTLRSGCAKPGTFPTRPDLCRCGSSQLGSMK